ncbi:MAG TPA: PAS domain S-box protein, partial [Chitinophagaceae bacterium]|nr:PAS domain S-box protein [Chitinophagaceae bacterium]
MKQPLKILLLEDSNTDAEIIMRLLLKEIKNSEVNLAMSKHSFLKELENLSADIILSDNSLPQFNALEALKLVRQQSLHIPFILVTGTVSEEYAANIIKQGADDYILKDRMARLPVAIEAAIRNRQVEKEKMESAQKLKRSEENYRSIMERVSDAFVALDRDWNYTYVNKQAGQILNRDPAELIGKNIWKEFPEDIDQTFYKAYSRAMETQQYIHLEEYYPPFNIWLENHVYPSPDGLSIFFRNITENKKAEQQLKKSYDENQALAQRMSVILNTLPANIALLDDQGIIIDVNDAWKNLAETNKFIGSSYGIGDNYITIAETSNGADKGDGKNVAAGINSVLKGKIKEFIYEYTYDFPGVQRWLRMVATALQEKQSGAVVMHIDISELKQLEKERLESKINEQNRTTQAMLRGQEIERNAIGIELHDNVNQILVGTKLYLSMMKKDSVSNLSFIGTCIDSIQQAIDENRKIAHALVTPDFEAIKLTEQLSDLTDSMLQSSGLAVYFENSRFSETQLNNEQQLVAYRIAQEQFTNIIKHAKAQL